MPNEISNISALTGNSSVALKLVLAGDEQGTGSNVVSLEPRNVETKSERNKAPPVVADVEKAVSTLNEFAASIKRDLRFTIDESTDRVIITVIESESGNIVRQIPPEEALAISNYLDKTEPGTAASRGLLLADQG